MDIPLSLRDGQFNARPTVTFPIAEHNRSGQYQIILSRMYVTKMSKFVVKTCWRRKDHNPVVR